MALPNHHTRTLIERILNGETVEEACRRHETRSHKTHPLPPRLTGTVDHSQEALDDRREILKELGIKTDSLIGQNLIQPGQLAANIENQVGMARIPVGVAGPLRITGQSADGDFYIPLATTEGALVASYHRGALVASLSGGVTTLCVRELVTRAPCFVFKSVRDVALFLAWLLPKFEHMKNMVGETTSHGELLDLRTSIIGKEVYLLFEFMTGDAGGQNMVTVATHAICEWISQHSPLPPEHWFIDGNLSGDKKATMQAFTHTRGKKVLAEAVLKAKLVRRFLHAEVSQMYRYWQISALGGVQSGSIGVQGHYSNGLAALYIACGQDVACVAEAAVGITRMDVTDEGDLYVAVSMPNLICGTVGGGTHLPTARECLEMMDCYGAGKVRKFAEIICATILCGEVSIIGAMAAGDFSSAHSMYGRNRKVLQSL